MADLSSPRARTLLTSVRKAPDDPGVWLVLADWLTDNSDERGRLIVLRQRLADPGLSEATRGDMRRQIEAIEEEHRPQWASVLPLPAGARPLWRCGLLVGVWLPLGCGSTHGHAVGARQAARAPIGCPALRARSLRQPSRCRGGGGHRVLPCARRAGLARPRAQRPRCRGGGRDRVLPCAVGADRAQPRRQRDRSRGSGRDRVLHRTREAGLARPRLQRHRGPRHVLPSRLPPHSRG